MDAWLGGPKNWPGCFGEVENLFALSEVAPLLPTLWPSHYMD